MHKKNRYQQILSILYVRSNGKKMVRIRKPPQLWVSVDSRTRIKKGYSPGQPTVFTKCQYPIKVFYW